MTRPVLAELLADQTLAELVERGHAVVLPNGDYRVTTAEGMQELAARVGMTPRELRRFIRRQKARRR